MCRSERLTTSDGDDDDLAVLLSAMEDIDAGDGGGGDQLVPGRGDQRPGFAAKWFASDIDVRRQEACAGAHIASCSRHCVCTAQQAGEVRVWQRGTMHTLGCCRLYWVVCWC